MQLFSRFRRRPARAVVIGLDGTPFSLIRRLADEGRMPAVADLLARGSLREMRSVVPTVSSVAWTSITTGCNPGRHGLYGFVDRLPATHEMFIPTGRHRRVPSWIEHFSGIGRRVFSMGVPGTYPPRAVNSSWLSPL